MEEENKEITQPIETDPKTQSELYSIQQNVIDVIKDNIVEKLKSEGAKIEDFQDIKEVVGEEQSQEAEEELEEILPTLTSDILNPEEVSDEDVMELEEPEQNEDKLDESELWNLDDYINSFTIVKESREFVNNELKCKNKFNFNETKGGNEMPDKKITNQKENNMKQIKDIIKEQAVLFYKEKSKSAIKESKVQTKDQKPKQKSQKKILKEAEDLDKPKVTDTDVTSSQNEIPEVEPETPKEDIFSGIKEELSSKLEDALEGIISKQADSLADKIKQAIGEDLGIESNNGDIQGEVEPEPEQPETPEVPQQGAETQPQDQGQSAQELPDEPPQDLTPPEEPQGQGTEEEPFTLPEEPEEPVKTEAEDFFDDNDDQMFEADPFDESEGDPFFESGKIDESVLEESIFVKLFGFADGKVNKIQDKKDPEKDFLSKPKQSQVKKQIPTDEQIAQDVLAKFGIK